MSANFSASIIAQLKARVVSEMERLQVPGVAIGMISGPEFYTVEFGSTSLNNPLPITADTLFQIGSITKTITALAAMRLVDAGLLNLDTPIRTYIPDLRLADETVAQRVTLRHVFTHTGGWLGDYFDDLGPGDDALAKMVSRMVNLPQETPLGEIWSYNNAGFYLAGRVLELMSGKTYEAAVKELVLDPIGMTNSFFFPADLMTYRFVVGHDAVYPGEERSPRVLTPWALARSGNAVGGLACSVIDLLRYARFQMGDGRTETGERLLSAESLRKMHTPTVAAANGEAMGLAWFIREANGVRLIRHGGATTGQMATFTAAPERQFAFAALTNSERGSELYQPLSRWALEQFLGIQERDPEPLAAPEEQLAEFVGVYQAAADDLKVSLRQGELVLEEIPKGGFPAQDSPPSPPPPPVRMALCGPDRVIVLDEPGRGNQGEFLRDAEGRLVWFRFGGRVHKKMEG
jgi:CubicO group peptidase (beta-lactamase class C family)